jgi:hypothetical protein
MRINWADPKKVSPKTVLQNRIMRLNLTLLPEWEKQLMGIEQKIDSCHSLHALFKFRGQLQRMGSEVTSKLRDVSLYLRKLHVDRSDVPLAQVRKLFRGIERATAEINARITSRDELMGKRPARSPKDVVSPVRNPFGPARSSDQFLDGPSAEQLLADLRKLSLG